MGTTVIHRWLSRLQQPALCLIFAGTTLATAASAESTRPISLHYNPRPPYEFISNGAVVGVVASPIEGVFRKAGIPFKWVETPVARQFLILKADKGQHCLAGRFKTPEREAIAKFSKPVYQDQPQGLIVRADNAKAAAHTSMQSAVVNPELQIVVKLSYSYGATIDAWLAQRNPPAKTTTDESAGMLRQINLGMADGFVVATEEAQELIKRSNEGETNFRLLKFADAPPGELRYIMCNHHVPKSTMDKLNSAIAFQPR